MSRRAQSRWLLLVAYLSLGGIFLIDVLFATRMLLPDVVYAFPVLLAAVLLEARPVVAFTVISMAMQAISAAYEHNPWRELALNEAALLMIGVLAAMLKSALHKQAELRARAEDAADALREVDRRRNEFLAVLSHELRNPLAPIRNSLYVLDRAGGLNERGRHATQVIDRQVGQITRLVGDLLDVTRIARGKVHLQRGTLDFGDLVRRAVDDHRSVFDAAGIDLEFDGRPGALWVDGDAARLAQAIGNLLQNAAKFTPRGGRVRAAVGRHPSGRASASIEDNGVGMDAQTLEQIFNPFVQADRSLDRSRGGLGLGLALVKGLVEMHGGTVVAASAGPDRGSQFTVTLPLLPQDAARPSPGALDRPRLEGC